MKHLAFVLGLGILASAAPAAVLETSPASFAIEFHVVVPGAPYDAYRRLTRDVSRWWDPSHTWSGDARNLRFDARAGGCFCEELRGTQPSQGEDGSVQHGRIVFAQPGKLLRLDAALGPFQAMPVTGVLSFQFAAEGGSTKVTVSYRVSGAMSPEPAKLAPMAEAMLTGQMQRFQAYLETGRPAK